MTAEILAAMLALATPGHSEYSRVSLRHPCDTEACQGVVERLTGHVPRLDMEGFRTRWEGWTRPETPAEGARRFAVIAAAIAYVAKHPPASWSSSYGPYPQRDLWRGLVTIGRHESAFWRSVHAGRIRGAAGEWGLFQIHPSVLASLGVEGPDLVGLSMEATTRSALAAAELLGRARRLCPPSFGDGWWAPTIAAYGSGQGCAVTNDWVAERVETFERTAKPRPLSTLGVLGLMTLDAAPDWRLPEPSAEPLPRVTVTELRTVIDETPECDRMEHTPCLQRLGAGELTQTLVAVAVEVFRAHRLDAYGTEVHLDHAGRPLVAKIEVHSDWARGDHKGLTLFEVVDDWCGSGGEATCGPDAPREP